MVTIDELMILYKGKYCTIRQFYMNKPIRFEIKLYTMASGKSRFVSNIEVYLGKGTGLHPHGLGYGVVTRLMEGVHGRRHILVVDNFFSSVRFFHDLMMRGTCSTGTFRCNRKGLLEELKRPRSKTHRGSLCMKMHRH